MSLIFLIAGASGLTSGTTYGIITGVWFVAHGVYIFLK